jgi:hypothetical protein
MNEEHDGIYLCVALFLLGATMYGSYFIGRSLERKAYTEAFAIQVNEAYNQGFADRAAQDMLMPVD